MARRSATETAAILDILERRKSVSPDLIQPARELIVRVVSMLAQIVAGHGPGHGHGHGAA